MRRIQISVVGYDRDSCTEAAYKAAYRVGRAIASSGAVLVCGGRGGVMEAACKGAHDGGGLSLGVIPSSDLGHANASCDLVVATGLGHARDFLVAYSGDAMVIVGGGAGTLIEAAAAYQAGKPLAAVRGTGGVADELAGGYVDQRKIRRVIGSHSPEGAVRAVVRELAGGGKKGPSWSPARRREKGGKEVRRPLGARVVGGGGALPQELRD